MATKIRRCLYIGLGGTGMKALLHTKKMFIDTYGEVPPMIGFLGIDTDGGEYTKSVKSRRGDDVKLTPNEQLQLVAPGAVDFYLNNKPDFTWVPQCTVNAIAMLRGEGAGGVRSNGRVAFTINKNRVSQEVASKINDITNANIITNDKYALLANGLPEIHMVFSICGGTGCGSFINMAYLLKELNPNYKVTGYAVLPGVFKNLPACAHVMPNTYGALVDLDYLMHQGIGNQPVEIKYIGNKYEASERPFTNVLFIDSDNAANDHIDDVDSLTEMTSLALITAAGELSVANASVGDNFSVMISMDTLNIENKKAWAGGMGACEILYRGDTLADIYNMKAAQHIIARLFNSCDDANVIANAWIDSAEVQIRENNGRDNVTDFIGAKGGKFDLTIDNMDNPRPEVDANIERNKISAEDSTQKIKTLLERSRTELRKLLVKHINSECGVSTAQNIIEELKSQIGICLKEMYEEKEALAGKVAASMNKIESLSKDISETTSFFRRGARKEMCNELAAVVKTHNAILRDIQRHEGAITFYNSMLVTLDESADRIQNIAEKLKNVRLNLTEKINRLQVSTANSGSIFQLNLAEEDAKNIVVKAEDIIISEFIDSLGGNKLYDFGDEIPADEIEKQILAHTAKFKGANVYRNKGVEDVLRSIYEKNPAELKRIIEVAYRKSMPLFQYDHRGRAPKQNMIEMIYVGVENQGSSILKQDDMFKNCIPATDGLNVTRNVAFASVGMKDKIIIYHQVGVVPVYALIDIYNYKQSYVQSYNQPEGHHFDDDMRVRMEHESFDIFPKKRYDDNNMIDYWVRGFIFGLIKNENGKYMMKSKSLGNALDGYWVSLGSAYRNEAFDDFKRKEVSVIRDFAPHFVNEINSRGDDAIKALIADVKENYYAAYSQIKLDRKTLDSHGYEKVKDLVEQELRHIETL